MYIKRLNERFRPFFRELIIDIERLFTLSNLIQIKKNGEIIETDRNSMIMNSDLKVEKKEKDKGIVQPKK